MAFDAGMFAAVISEINKTASDSRVEKVYQPEKEEVVLLLRTQVNNLRLSLRAGSNSPRFGITAVSKENPEKAPMFCMLLRKHLAGSKFVEAFQQGFERAAEFVFDSHDEMGYACKKYLIIEIMGTYSNVILLGQDRQILGAMKTVDLTDNSGRAVLPGMIYEKPPAQEKLNPLETDYDTFIASVNSADGEITVDKFFMKKFMGISSLIARELSFSVSKQIDAVLRNVDENKLWFYFSAYADVIREKRFVPTLLSTKEGKPIEYTFIPIRQYGSEAIVGTPSSFCELTDSFFGAKEHIEHIKQRSTDVLRLLTNADTRLRKKIALQTEELAACRDAEKFRIFGDLLTSNIHAVKKGAKSVTVANYYEDDCPEIVIPLDERLSPSQNAQRFYKKYAKLKVANTELTKQIETAKAEIEYIDTVFDHLARAQNENDLADIRMELCDAGYASKLKNTVNKKKKQLSSPYEYRTTDGLRILCGRNNVQNDYLTTKLADRSDYWFHVKNSPGSHVILFCDGAEPSDRDFTEAAEIAAYNSKCRGGSNISVDYTKVRNVKKPGGSKPGFVIYSTNYTAVVSPEQEKLNRLSVK